MRGSSLSSESSTCLAAHVEPKRHRRVGPVESESAQSSLSESRSAEQNSRAAAGARLRVACAPCPPVLLCSPFRP
jgi:hypothetical protein